jgi:uncharacterized membrane protein YphA (DoxX/SURF4 family)
MRETLFFWMSCWCTLALLFLPFPFIFLPNIGMGLSTLIYPLNAFICSWFDTDIRHSYLVSDSLAFYTTGGTIIIVSGLLTLLIQWKKRDVQPTIQKIVFFALILFLAYFLIRYGLDKLFHRQFYTPAANTLHTSVGHLDKDILFWTSMGTSSFYNAFMAITEISAGVLLLFNRTRFLALIIGFGILLNVFAINIGFDITVKYFSGLLLIACGICLCFYRSQLKFLIQGKISEQVLPVLSQTWMLLFFTPFLVDLIASYWHNPPNESGKSYLVKSLITHSDFIDTEGIVRIHVHPRGYFITENEQQQFTSFKLSEDKKSVLIHQHVISISIKEESLLLKQGNDSIHWKVEKIDLEKLPVNQDKTHWYFEMIVEKE